MQRRCSSQCAKITAAAYFRALLIKHGPCISEKTLSLYSVLILLIAWLSPRIYVMELLYYLRPSTFCIEVLAAVLGVGSNISGSNAVSTCTQLTTFRMSDAEDEGRLRLKCDGTRAENRFRLLAKRTSPFKSAGVSVQSTADSRGVRTSRSNAAHTMLRGGVKNTCYPLHSPVSPSLPLPCVILCHHISTGLYYSSSKHRNLFTTNKASQPRILVTVFRLL